MKKISILGLIFLAILFQKGSEVSYSAESNETSDIRFEQTEFDFGSAGQHEKIRHDFKFKNEGKGTLIIKEVRPSCGCVATLISSKEIPPSGAGAIETTFETGKYEGKQSKEIYVFTNDPNKQEVVLKLSGTVKNEIALEPQSLFFSDVQKGTKVSKSFKVIQTDEKELKINKLEAPKEYFSTRISDFKDQRHKGYKIDVTLKAEAPVGQFTQVMTVHTNSSKYPRIDVPVWGNIAGIVKVKPQMVSLGSLNKGASCPNKIEIESLSKKGFKIQKVSSNLPYLSAKLTTIKKNQKFAILLKITDDAPAGRMDGEIEIHTNVPDESLIKVTVHGLIIR